MNKYILLLLAVLCSAHLFSQNTFKAVVKDAESNETIPGVVVTITELNKVSTTDENGLVELTDIPNGSYLVEFHFTEYEERADTILFPVTTVQPLEILLSEIESDDLEEVVISTTRSSRTIQDIPTRVEAITAEELDEKNNMKPGDVRMLLSESTGIQTQQTSPTSANSTIRIQGLDGRYTQMLKDGFPLYAGFSGGLGVMQIPPLDLKQVELIKGSASTLYGGGAIAGLINFISKTPTEKREISFLLNGTSALGLDVSGFYSQKFKRIGLTVFASRNSNEAYDPAKNGFSAIPKFERYTFNPRLFVYINDKTTFNFGLNTMVENRLGGDLKYLKGQGDSIHSYFERNQTQRYATQLQFNRELSEKSRITIKNSVSFFDRKIAIPDYNFRGKQISTFSEIAYSQDGKKSDWVTGVNAWTDNFQEPKPDSVGARNYDLTTLGVFAQNTLELAEWFTLESGLRADYIIPATNDKLKGLFLLPRISGLFKVNRSLSSRLGGGMGYKSPTIFTEEAENLTFRNILPLNISSTKAEQSYGGNFDVNYRTRIGEKVSFNINQMFFYTRLESPLILTLRPDNLYEFSNANGHIDTKGAETNMKISYGIVKLFAGYTYTDTKRHYNDTLSAMPLTAKHRVNLILMFEKEDKFRIGLEAYYFSPQQLADGSTGRDYWVCGLMAEKKWEKISIYVNFENFLDARQTRFGSIYSGTVTNPAFKQIYAPVDGRVINAGIKLKL